MTLKTSTSHDEALTRELRDDPTFAAEYLRAARDDLSKLAVLPIALGRFFEPQNV